MAKCDMCNRDHEFTCGRCFKPIIRSATYWQVCHPNILMRSYGEKDDGKFCWGDPRMIGHDPNAKTLAEDPMGIKWAT